MKRRGSLLRQLGSNETVMENAGAVLPLVEIVDDRRVLIEHHKGVVGYSGQEVCVRVGYGQITVSGEGLRLARMSAQQVVICGRIEGVHLRRSGR